MGIFDVICFALCLGSAVIGARRGLLNELGKFLPWVAGCILPFLLTKSVSPFLKGMLPHAVLGPLTGGIIFLGAFWGIKFAIKILAATSTALGLDVIMGPLGFLTGILRGIILCVLMIWILEATQWSKQAWLIHSSMYKLYVVYLKGMIKKYSSNVWIRKHNFML
jgi:uncharacterized membrane protein required for colicin V production